MKLTSALILVPALLSAFAPGGVAATFNLPATANIFGAGTGTTPEPGGGGGGTAPIGISLSLSQGNVFQFQASGQVSQYYSYTYHNPDGWTGGNGGINAYGGISGLKSEWFLPLVGVFLSDAAPQNPAPPTLDFRNVGIGMNFPTLSPLLGQEFFIGDGRTSGNVVQSFYAPGGATRLYLGFADAVGQFGDPGAYADNEGSLIVGVTQVPEPGSAAIVVGGLCAMVALRCGKRTS